MVPVPMIYEESKCEVYFMTKDVSNLKIQKTCFDPKKVIENPVVSLYKIKCENILLFSYHEEKFYIMEENKTIRQIGKEI